MDVFDVEVVTFRDPLPGVYRVGVDYPKHCRGRDDPASYVVVVERDVFHCGGCGNVCAPNDPCRAGVCGCDPGLIGCNRKKNNKMSDAAAPTATAPEAPAKAPEAPAKAPETAPEATAEDAAAIQGYDTALVMEYYADVRRESLRYLDTLSPEDLKRCPRPEQRPGYSIGKMFSHIIVEEAQHVGQVAYLRGLQRGLNK